MNHFIKKKSIFFIFLIVILSLQGALRAQDVSEYPAAALQERGRESSASSSAIITSNYCTFLNELAEQRVGPEKATNYGSEFLGAITASNLNDLYDERMLGALIMRTGLPGSYCYNLISKASTDSFNSCTAGLSWNDAEQYCNWRNNAALTSTYNLTSCNAGAAHVDHSLKSNQLTFRLVDMGSSAYQSGGPEVVEAAGAEEVGEVLEGLALIFSGWGISEGARRPEAVRTDDLSSRASRLTRTSSGQELASAREIQENTTQRSRSVVKSGRGRPAIDWNSEEIQQREEDVKRLKQERDQSAKASPEREIKQKEFENAKQNLVYAKSMLQKKLEQETPLQKPAASTPLERERYGFYSSDKIQQYIREFLRKAAARGQKVEVETFPTSKTEREDIFLAQEAEKIMTLARALKPPLDSVHLFNWQAWAEEIIRQANHFSADPSLRELIAQYGIAHSEWVDDEFKAAWALRIKESAAVEKTTRSHQITNNESHTKLRRIEALAEADRRAWEAVVSGELLDFKGDDKFEKTTFNAKAAFAIAKSVWSDFSKARIFFEQGSNVENLRFAANAAAAAADASNSDNAARVAAAYAAAAANAAANANAAARAYAGATAATATATAAATASKAFYYADRAVGTFLEREAQWAAAAAQEAADFAKAACDFYDAQKKIKKEKADAVYIPVNKLTSEELELSQKIEQQEQWVVSCQQKVVQANAAGDQGEEDRLQKVLQFVQGSLQRLKESEQITNWKIRIVEAATQESMHEFSASWDDIIVLNDSLAEQYQQGAMAFEEVTLAERKNWENWEKAFSCLEESAQWATQAAFHMMKALEAKMDNYPDLVRCYQETAKQNLLTVKQWYHLAIATAAKDTAVLRKLQADAVSHNLRSYELKKKQEAERQKNAALPAQEEKLDPKKLVGREETRKRARLTFPLILSENSLYEIASEEKLPGEKLSSSLTPAEAEAAKLLNANRMTHADQESVFQKLEEVSSVGKIPASALESKLDEEEEGKSDEAELLRNQKEENSEVAAADQKNTEAHEKQAEALAQRNAWWSNLTSSQKKNEIAMLWKTAQKKEQTVLMEAQEAIAALLHEEVVLWNGVLQKANDLKTVWTELTELYQQEKEHPPYWIKSRWMDELKAAENKKLFWEAKLLSYQAAKEEAKTYLSQEQAEGLMATDRAVWNGVIDHAIVTASLWDNALKKCKEEYNRVSSNKALEHFKNEWKEELEKVRHQEHAWHDTLLWYAGQGGRLSDPEIIAIERQRDIVYVESSPLDGLSNHEKKHFPNAQLIDHKEFSDPSDKAKGKVHVRILKTTSQGPYIRVEEFIDHSKGLVMRKEMEADHLLVTLKEGLDEETFLQWVKDHGYSSKKATKTEPLYRLYFKPASEDKWEEAWEKTFDDAREIDDRPEPNFFFECCTTPNDEQYTGQWSLSNSTRGIRAPHAWDIRTDASLVKVGIADSGIFKKHPDLQDNVDDVWYNARESENGTEPIDRTGHGTAMAGIIGAVADNNIGIAGIAWKVNLMDFKFLNNTGRGNGADFAKCIEAAIERGVHILNCSIGLGVGFSGKVEAVLKKAYNAGVIVVTSAGNAQPGEVSVNCDELTDEFSRHYPSMYKYHAGNFRIRFPNMVIVAASEQDSDHLAKFSFYGANSIDIAAPGTNILSTTNYSVWDPRPLIWKGYHRYKVGGTSASAAHATGALALLKAHRPELTATELVQQLLDNADTITKLKSKIKGGRRLNLANALIDGKNPNKNNNISTEESESELDNPMPSPA